MSTANDQSDRSVFDHAAVAERLFEHVGDMVCLLDVAGRFVWVNTAGERLTGCSAGELEGRSAAELIAPEHRQRAIEQFQERLLAEAGRPADESVLLRHDGTRAPIEISSILINGPEGPTAVLGLVRDLSRQRDVEDALRQSEEQFRGAFTNAAIGMAIVAPDGRFVQVNDALCRMVGYSEQELVERGFQEITHPDDLAPDLALVQRTLDGEIDSYAMEKRYFHRDGRLVWVGLTVSLVRGSDGSPVHFVSQVQDITERKQAELRYRTLVEQLPLVTYIRPTDLSKPNTYCSPQIEEMLGCTAEDWQTNPDMLSVVVHPEDKERVLEDAARLRKTGEPLWAEYRYIRPDGGVVWVQDETYLVENEHAEPCVQGYLLDITPRKLAEEERDRLQEQLHHAQKLEAIGQLAGGIAHDFNNTLTAIRGYGELLAAALSDDEQLRRYAEEIRKTADAGAALPRQLLAFGRKQPLELKTLELNQVVADSCDLLRPLLGGQIDFAWIPGPTLSVVSDGAQLGQALLNLALNARDAMPDGGQLTVELRWQRLDAAAAEAHQAPTGDYAVIVVRDTGCGMDDVTRQRAFEPFFTTKETGTGLGLATVYGIVGQSGGFVSVESSPGRGTTFELYLPSESPVAVQDKGGAPVGGTLLVVEDEESVRGLVREVLELAGFRVLQAANGFEALSVFDRHRDAIDGLVTDLKMPGIDGSELARTIRERKPGLPVVAVSAYTDHPPDGEELILLSKPFSAADLVGAVDQALRETWPALAPVPDQEPLVSVLIADDHPPVLDSVSRVLELKGFRVVGTAIDGETALRRIVDRRPAVALVDIRMSGMSGVEVARRAAELAPRTAVVLYTGQADRDLLREALDAGARGFLFKDAPLEDVAATLRRAAAGETHVDPALAGTPASPEAAVDLPTLTRRERQVLSLLAEGMTNDRAAGELEISPETVQTHVRKAMAKLQADTRTGAVATALRLALIA